MVGGEGSCDRCSANERGRVRPIADKDPGSPLWRGREGTGAGTGVNSAGNYPVGVLYCESISSGHGPPVPSVVP